VLAGVAIAFLFFHYLWIPVIYIPRPTAQVLAVVGLVLYGLGPALLLIARRTLGKYWGISTSRRARLLPDHRLIRTGPYALVRHPMYLGGWVLFLGLVLLYPVWAMFLMFLFGLISFGNRARREEAALAAHFGEKWKEYQDHTRMFIPLVW
jgi:protein-S-isoprenylcysteine O-methyltransferase Ste14